MPGRKHLNGVGPKEQRMYEHIKEDAQKSGRYGKRAKEVAARTVLKHPQRGRPFEGEVICWGDCAELTVQVLPSAFFS